MYTFVSKEKFYLSLGLLSSLGYLNTKLTTRQPDGDITTNQDNFIFRWDGKVGLGYNVNSFYTGLYSTISGTEYRQENTTAMNFETRVFGKVYSIEGDVATNIQFSVTDSVKHVLAGALYFYTKPNYDSIIPAIRYIEKDMMHLVETIEWNK